MEIISGINKKHFDKVISLSKCLPIFFNRYKSNLYANVALNILGGIGLIL